jgi:hypothetical protein
LPGGLLIHVAGTEPVAILYKTIAAARFMIHLFD